MNLGDIWLLANGIIKDELLDKLNELLEKEIPTYYKNWADKQVNY